MRPVRNLVPAPEQLTAKSGDHKSVLVSHLHSHPVVVCRTRQPLPPTHRPPRPSYQRRQSFPTAVVDRELVHQVRQRPLLWAAHLRQLPASLHLWYASRLPSASERTNTSTLAARPSVYSKAHGQHARVCRKPKAQHTDNMRVGRKPKAQHTDNTARQPKTKKTDYPQTVARTVRTAHGSLRTAATRLVVRPTLFDIRRLIVHPTVGRQPLAFSTSFRTTGVSTTSLPTVLGGYREPTVRLTVGHTSIFRTTFGPGLG
jgi:hypothetical protein